MVPLLLLIACHPPIDINTAPMVSIESPGDDGQVFNEGGGFSVVATVNDRDGDDLVVELSSSSQGVIDTAEVAAGSQVALSTEGLGQGDHVLVVTARDGVLSGSDQVQVTINGAPSTPQIRILPEQPNTADDLTANLTAEAVDPEGGLMDYEWHWSREGETRIYTDDDGVLPHVLSSALTSKDEVWVFTIEATEAAGANPITVEGTARVTILNAPPGSPVVDLLPDQPHPLSALSCHVVVAASDADGDEISYQYAWLINGLDVEGDGGSTLPATYTAEGDTVECTATATDGTDIGGSGTDSVSIGGGELSLSGAAVVIRGSQARDEVGSHATGLMLNPTDGVDDLAIGAPAYFSGQGVVAMYQGGGLSDTDLSGRRFGVSASAGWALGGPLLTVDDTDGDGHRDLVVAAQGGSAAPTVLVIPGRSFVTSTTIPATDTAFQGTALRHATAELGWGVALAGGDVDGDGLADIAITHQGTSGSQIYLFTADDLASASGAPPYITSAAADLIDGSSAGSTLGLASSASGDLDGDGQDDLAVSAPDSDSATHTWVFTEATEAADLSAADLVITHTTTAGSPGTAVLLVPDLDGDGYDELAISSPWENVGGKSAGAVALFKGSSLPPASTSLVQADLWVHGLQADMAFGAQVVDLGDVDGDGLSDLAVSAPNARGNGYPGSGQVWIFAGADLPLTGTAMDTSSAVLRVDGEEVGAGIHSPGPAGDLDGDGLDDLLVGFPGYDYGSDTDVGGIFVFFSGS